MLEQNISNQWICECTTINPLRKRCCVNCGRGVPQTFLNKIYKEEINNQNIFFRMQRREKEIVRCKKAGIVLQKMQVLMIVLFVAAFIVCNGVRFYYYPNTVNSFKSNYYNNRIERLREEQGVFKQHFKGVKQAPDVISGVWISMWESFGDIGNGLSKDNEDSKKSINEDKVNHITEKIMEVKDYVTRKLR